MPNPIHTLPAAVRAEFIKRHPHLVPQVETGGDRPRVRLPCIHEGPVVEACKTCGGAEDRHVRACLHPDPSADRDTCTRAFVSDRVQACSACPDYAPQSVGKRHLVYHVLPVGGNGTWRRGIDQLRGRWGLFTGTKTVAVVTGPGLDPPADVRDYLPPGCDVVVVENDPNLREVVTWVPLWDRVLSAAADEDAVFYAHAKAVTRPVDPGNSCHWWASLAYSVHLDHWPLVESQLGGYPITGAFKKVGPGFGSAGDWHYSGSFFWARAGDFRNRPWRAVDRAWWGTEAWPGRAYAVSEAGCLFLSGTVPSLDMYSPPFWETVVRPRYAEWLKLNPPAVWPTSSSRG